MTRNQLEKAIKQGIKEHPAVINIINGAMSESHWMPRVIWSIANAVEKAEKAASDD